jgi:type II secretory pathway component PulF
MPTFEYKAKNPTGELVTGTLVASDRRGAVGQLDAKGFFPVLVEPAREKKQRGQIKLKLPPLRSNISEREILFITDQLANLLRSGMSLSKALDTMAKRVQNDKLTGIIEQVHQEIINGSSLSDALESIPGGVFPRLYVNMVRAGEVSGTLPEILKRLSAHYAQVREIREQVQAALIYPSVLITVGIGTIIFFMTFMVPRFKLLFAGLGQQLPLPTRILIGMSSTFVSWWWVGAILIVAAIIWYKRYQATEEGRLRIDEWKLNLPLFGPIMQRSAFAQFARTLAALLRNGVPVLEALKVVADIIQNKVVSREIMLARERVTDGTTISSPLAAGKIFPPLLIDMLAVGEETGDMINSLDQIADTYESDLKRSIKVMLGFLEPAIIIFMGLTVGVVVFSMLIAVFRLTTGIGR